MDWSNEQGEEAERESETVFAITGNIFFFSGERHNFTGLLWMKPR